MEQIEKRLLLHSPGLFSLANFCQLLFVWLERARQRQALSRLDERMLKDVGISASEADNEIRKPFWRS